MSTDPQSLATLANVSDAKSKKQESSPVAQNAKSNERPRSMDEYVAGSTAAFINVTILFPVNKLIFRQMTGGYGTQVAVDQLKKEGYRYLYRGILPPLLQKMVSVSIMYGSFEHYKGWIERKFENSSPIANLALAACLSGTTEAILTPLERIQMLLQDRKFHRDYKNAVDALIKLRKFGIAEYYRGLTCVLVRNGPSNILFFGLKGEITKLLSNCNDEAEQSRNENSDSQQNLATTQFKSLLSGYKPQHLKDFIRPKNSILHDFLSGAILGMFISTLCYPLSVVRTRMQTRAPGTEFLSIVKAFNAVYNERDRRFSRLFHGCSINALRQCVSWGLINCSYEYTLGLLHNAK